MVVKKKEVVEKKTIKKEKKQKLTKGEFTSGKKKEDERVYAFVATFLSIIGFLIAIVAWRKNKYVMYYAKQSLVIFGAGVVAGIVERATIGLATIGGLIRFALGIIIFLVWLMSWIYALSGEKKEIPVISDLAKKIDL